MSPRRSKCTITPSADQLTSRDAKRRAVSILTGVVGADHARFQEGDETGLQPLLRSLRDADGKQAC